MSDDLVVERRIAAPPSVVYAYLTDSEKWAGWQGATASLDPVRGGMFAMTMGNGMRARGRFLELVPDSRVVFTWGWIDHPGVPPGSSTVSIELVADGGGTVVRLTHSGLPVEEVPIHAAGWAHYLPRLSAVAVHGDAGIDLGPPQTLVTERLALEPLTVDHADEMLQVLSAPSIYDHLDYPPPPDLDYLRDVYGRLAEGRSPDAAELWLNWIVRKREDGLPIGTVQATVVGEEAWVAYVLHPDAWGSGFASEATSAMIDHLAAGGVSRFLAVIEEANGPSRRLLERLGFEPGSRREAVFHELTETERLWTRPQSQPLLRNSP